MDLKTYRVTLIDDSQAQDREDSTYDVTVKAYSADEAAFTALIDEPVNVYAIAVQQTSHSISGLYA